MGRPTRPILPLTAAQEKRFWSKVDRTPEEGCWLWLGGGTRYGIVSVNNKNECAHRVAFFLATEEQPPEVCHSCDTLKCVRPDHLFAGDPGVNARDRQSKGRGAPQHSEHNPSAKLTYVIAEGIRAEYRQTGTTQQRLADKYGVSIAQINFIVNGKAYTKPPKEEVMP